MVALFRTLSLAMAAIILPCAHSAPAPVTPSPPPFDSKSKSFIGTLGFPSSGNVWMQEILRFTPGVSTIHSACAAKNGANTVKVCTNSQFSAFAQSSMGKKGNLNLKIDVLCTLETTPEIVEQTKKYLREVVRNGYWNTNQSYFVESSTRLALRLPLLRQAADMFGDQKYIISIKHPICVAGGFASGEWLQAALKNTSWSAYQDMLILLDVDGMKTSHQHQGKTLCDTYAPGSRGASWLLFMKSLHEMLSEDEDWSLKHVRIVRYEDFQSRPVQLCENLFKFIFVDSHDQLKGVTDKSSPYFWGDEEIQQTCKGLFSKAKAKAKRRLRQLPIPHSSSSHSRRLKRTPLMGSQYHLATSLNYNPKLVNTTCNFAMTQFRAGYGMFPADLKEALQGISEKMSPYGYSLNPEQFFTTQSSILEKWNLMK